MPKYEFSQEKFVINPYTFVKSKKDVERFKEIEENEKLHTGVISCKLIVKTPLLIPDVEKAIGLTDDKNVEYPFMSIGNSENIRYIIPGSSLRGPIRSTYEALTNSCFVTAGSSQNISTRTKAPFEPGLLMWVGDKLVLKPARAYLFKVGDYKSNRNDDNNNVWCIATQEELRRKYRYGDTIYFEGRTSENGKYFVKKVGAALKKGYMYIGEYISKKRHESIFIDKKEPNILSENLDLAYQKLKETIKIYQNEKINKNLTKDQDGIFHHGYDQVDFESFENGEIEALPVWYKEIKQDETEQNKVYLSFAGIGRYNYEKGMGELLGERQPCTSRNNLCPACRIFGVTGKNDEKGIASRVRFSDIIIDEDIEFKKYSLSPLRSPHPSYLPFYAITSDYNQGYDAEGSDIRGRKFYWHHASENTDINNADTTIEGIKSGIFSFSVYYEDLTKAQLEHVLWLLCLGENEEDGKYCFKIGHGKSLGYGSVKIIVDGYKERIVDDGNYVLRSNSQSDVNNKVAEVDLFKNATDLKHVLNFNTLNNKEVSYPYVLDCEGKRSSDPNDVNMSSAKWFSENMKLGGQEATVLYKLSYPTDIFTGNDNERDLNNKIAFPVLKKTGE
nr:TIGR03986 family CRISPR-associated RAMP protein [uncultured Lachnoanaerobaculum sp.]